jgi:spore coat protein U-like protein
MAPEPQWTLELRQRAYRGRNRVGMSQQASQSMRKLVLTSLAVVLVVPPLPAFAVNKSAAFTSRIRIYTGCLISLGDLVFAPTFTLTGTETATSTVTILCSKHVPWRLSFSSTGPNPSTTGVMTGVTPGNTSTINYSMGFNGNATGTGTGFPQSKPLNATITTVGNVTADNYIQPRVLYVIY